MAYDGVPLIELLLFLLSHTPPTLRGQASGTQPACQLCNQAAAGTESCKHHQKILTTLVFVQTNLEQENPQAQITANLFTLHGCLHHTAPTNEGPEVIANADIPNTCAMVGYGLTTEERSVRQKELTSCHVAAPQPKPYTTMHMSGAAASCLQCLL